MADRRAGQPTSGGETLLPNTGRSHYPDAPEGSVALFGMFEVKITNDKGYSNPFDYHVIDLSAEFTAPSGKKYPFFGFYDGDGSGGLSGNVWRLRFMPNEPGTWAYSYSWSDGTPGGSGSFNVADTGIPGPLRVAQDNSWYFETARGEAFNWRGYSLHLYLEWKYGRGVVTDQGWADLQDKINTKVADRNYNAVMLAWPVFTRSGWPESNMKDNNGSHFWQQSGSSVDFTRFYIPQWKQVEKTIQTAANRGVYTFQFLALADQYTPRPNEEEMKLLARYMAARLGAYWNNFGYSATWEYQDIWNNGTTNDMMQRLKDNLSGGIGRLPAPPLLSIHDHSDDSSTGWQSFSTRQRGARDLFEGNCRQCGQHGNVGGAFVNKPIIGSEDIWEVTDTSDTPHSGTEVREAAWGEALAGVMPVYMEQTGASGSFNGEGESQVRRMWDFLYGSTRYRQYKQMNNRVASDKGQIASGIEGLEYLVYDVDGGSISINLGNESSSTKFQALWYDPKTGSQKDGGTVQGGGTRKLSSPFSDDSVLLLRNPAGGGSSGGFTPFDPKEWIFLPAVIKQ